MTEASGVGSVSLKEAGDGRLLHRQPWAELGTLSGIQRGFMMSPGPPLAHHQPEQLAGPPRAPPCPGSQAGIVAWAGGGETEQGELMEQRHSPGALSPLPACPYQLSAGPCSVLISSRPPGRPNVYCQTSAPAGRLLCGPALITPPPWACYGGKTTFTID